MSDAINPFQSFQQGYGVGQAINQNTQAIQAAEAERQRQAQYQAAFDVAMGPNSTPQDYMKLQMLTPQEERDSIQAAWEQMDLQTQQAAIKDGVETAALMENGAWDLVTEKFQRKYDAAVNSDDLDAQKTAKLMLGFLASGTPEGQQIAKAFAMTSLAGAPRS